MEETPDVEILKPESSNNLEIINSEIFDLLKPPRDIETEKKIRILEKSLKNWQAKELPLKERLNNVQDNLITPKLNQFYKQRYHLQKRIKRVHANETFKRSKQQQIILETNDKLRNLDEMHKNDIAATIQEAAKIQKEYKKCVDHIADIKLRLCALDEFYKTTL